MEFLFNPNTAYVLLVVGFILTLLAIVTPGTGILEVGAFFCLSLVAYVAYTTGFNPWALIVLVVSIVPFIYGTRKAGRKVWLGISIAAILISSFYLFNTGGWLPKVNPILGIFITALAGGFLWIMVSKTVKAHLATPSHNLDTLIGQVGEAKTDIRESGTAQIAGELWSVRSEKPLRAGSFIRVVKREGFILLVEENKD